MKSQKKHRPEDIISIFLLLFPLVLALAMVFPSYPIFGYSHSVLSSRNPDYYITITPQPLFTVLGDGFYSTGLKVGYVFLFVMEILCVMGFLALLLVFFLRKEKASKVSSFLCSLLLIILYSLVIAFFYSVM